MIPPGISRNHVLAAIGRIRDRRVPEKRAARKFWLVHEDRRYSPKYVVSVACEIARGTELNSEEFSGGKETNGFLARLGFTIVDRAGRPLQPPMWLGDNGSERRAPSSDGEAQRRAKRQATGHSERCPRCKEKVRLMLERLYGRVEQEKRFDIPAAPNALLEEHRMQELAAIYETLCRLRGHRDFARAKQLPPCDFLVPEPGFVVEFDESQHFTSPRMESLRAYPAGFPFGFDAARWSRLCEQFPAHDNHPPDRDEQRAWYDTLRDFLPLLVKDLLPTVRIAARDTVWCDLDVESPEDRAFFRDWLGLPGSFQVTPISQGGAQPFWGRVIIEGPWFGGTLQARNVLEAVANHWPHEVKARILVTPGGFVSFTWPEAVTRGLVRDSLRPAREAMQALFEEADTTINALITPQLRSRLAERADVVTIGVDTAKDKISVSRAFITELHVELVYVIDLRTGAIHRTGKSYPTTGQARGLARVADLATHFVDIDGQTTLLLGCHDLSAFNPRGNANATGWRKELIADFHREVIQRKPEIVVQHPHTTDKVRTWLQAWAALRRLAPSVHHFASAGRYHDPEREKHDPLHAVLKATARGNSLDMVVRILP